MHLLFIKSHCVGEAALHGGSLNEELLKSNAQQSVQVAYQAHLATGESSLTGGGPVLQEGSHSALAGNARLVRKGVSAGVRMCHFPYAGNWLSRWSLRHPLNWHKRKAHTKGVSLWKMLSPFRTYKAASEEEIPVRALESFSVPQMAFISHL
ncbi:MAG: hypothetical protein HC862_15420 [Scytonema sp. RU_4_4]|nr:hypothetical protein [Scytonema sp. RU_4_4]NJR72614.1 hypothetical protein [Scytonema sp. CRU_2_7]